MTKMPLCDGGVGEDGEFAVDVLDMDLGHPQSAYGISVLALHILGSILEMSIIPILLLECVYNTITPWISLI